MLVTVIIPIYNAEQYLEDCLESVLCQKYIDTEIILVDDGSTDTSVELCDQYAAKYKNVISIHQNNKGVSSARNKGLSYAKGEYIYFCDSDDILHSEILYELVKNIEVQNVDICCCRYQNFSGKLSWNDSELDSNIEILNGMDMIYNIFQNSYNAGYLWNKLFKRSIINKEPAIRFVENLFVLEDQKFVLEYLFRCKNMSMLTKVLYGYRQNENGAIQGAFSDRKLTCIIGGEETWKICKKNKCDEKILSIVWNTMMRNYIYGYKNLFVSKISNKRYWKKFIQEKFVEYSLLPYEKDNMWNWKQKSIYYYMKFIFGRKKV